MTTEQERKMLECAAKACGLRHVDYTGTDYDGSGGLVLVNENGVHVRTWNPLTNALDTADMCAKLEINTFFYVSLPRVECWCEDHGDEQTIRHITYHNRTDAEKSKAWRLAATMVAAKTQGYEP